MYKYDVWNSVYWYFTVILILNVLIKCYNIMFTSEYKFIIHVASILLYLVMLFNYSDILSELYFCYVYFNGVISLCWLTLTNTTYILDLLLVPQLRIFQETTSVLIRKYCWSSVWYTIIVHVFIFYSYVWFFLKGGLGFFFRRLGLSWNILIL